MADFNYTVIDPKDVMVGDNYALTTTTTTSTSGASYAYSTWGGGTNISGATIVMQPGKFWTTKGTGNFYELGMEPNYAEMIRKEKDNTLEKMIDSLYD